MPILSDKHVINISFKHIESDADGNQNSTDVSAFLDNGVMKVKFKSGNKFIVLSLEALKEIIGYISSSVPQVGKEEKTSSEFGGDVQSSSAKPSVGNGISGALETAIFGSNPSGLNGGSGVFSQPTYASPTMIASSASAFHKGSIEGENLPLSTLLSGQVVDKEPENPRKKISKVKSLNLERSDRTDEEGRFIIDLDGSEEVESQNGI